jgi:cytochrome c oxidase assembly factor CtaG
MYILMVRYMYIYIYIFIERERERESEKEVIYHLIACVLVCVGVFFSSASVVGAPTSPCIPYKVRTYDRKQCSNDTN